MSTCLVLAGTLALLSVSAVVAFRGWPGLSPDVVSAQPTQLAQVSVRPVPPAADRTDPDAIVIAPRVVSAPRARAASTPTQARYSGRIREVVEAVQAPARPPTVAVAPTGPVVARSPASAQPQAQETVRKVGGGLGATVQRTGRGLGANLKGAGKDLSEGVQPISPELARTLEQVSETVGNVVHGLGGGVADLVETLTR